MKRPSLGGGSEKEAQCDREQQNTKQIEDDTQKGEINGYR